LWKGLAHSGGLRGVEVVFISHLVFFWKKPGGKHQSLTGGKYKGSEGYI
jgi:hypothetical protein